MTATQWADWLEKKMKAATDGTFTVYCDDARRISKLLCRLAILERAIECSGYDLSMCKGCGKPVVCIPDGLPFCEGCAAKEAEGQ